MLPENHLPVSVWPYCHPAPRLLAHGLPAIEPAPALSGDKFLQLPATTPRQRPPSDTASGARTGNADSVRKAVILSHTRCPSYCCHSLKSVSSESSSRSPSHTSLLSGVAASHSSISARSRAPSGCPAHCLRIASRSCSLDENSGCIYIETTAAPKRSRSGKLF